MSDTIPKPDFPKHGDNFVTLGPWRMLSGATWHSFELAAEAAHVRAATFAGDQMTAHRAGRRADRLKLRGPHPVPPVTPSTGRRPRS